MAYIRNIKFEYYTVCIMKNKQDVSPKRFDFESWIKKAVDEGYEKKEVEFDGIVARLEELEGDKENKIWKIRFLKLRDTNIPSIVKKAEEAKPIELSDDEYIGEDLLMLYDSQIQVAMIQCNRFAMGKRKLEKYINKVWDDQESMIVLLHICQKVDMNELRKKNFRQFVLRVANVHAIEETHRPLSKLINSYNELGGKSGTMVFSLGRGRQPKKGLSAEQIPIIFDDIYDNLDIVTDAVLKVRDDDGPDDFDVINLFNAEICDYIGFRLEKRTALAFEYATRIMIEKYLAKKSYIQDILK